MTIMTYHDLWSVIRTLLVVVVLTAATLFVAGVVVGVIG